jgi:replicative DNA helicase
MMQPAAEVTLTEIEVEAAVLGSFFERPEQFGESGADIDPKWFSDPILRYVFEECRTLIEAGNTLPMSVIVSMLPETVGQLPRERFYANLRMSGVPVGQLGSMIAVLKDRWARREALAVSELLRVGHRAFEADPFETAAEAIAALDRLNAARREKVAGTISDAALGLVASLDHPEALRGPTTGMLALDKRLNGYRAGQLYVIAGRPGMGKSAFMVSSLRRTAGDGYGVGIFSLEMTAEEIAARAISDRVGGKGPSFGDLLKGMISESDRFAVNETAAELRGLPMEIDASPRLTFSEIAARARRLKAKFEAEGRPLAVICIDHMGLVTPSDRYAGNKVAEAGEVSGAARALAKELDCCVILLCQLSRGVEGREDKRPTLADLRWSGEIEQDAHVVAFLYRPAYYLAQSQSATEDEIMAARWRLDFLIRKNRNGETGDVQLWCNIAHSSVRDE